MATNTGSQLSTAIYSLEHHFPPKRTGKSDRTTFPIRHTMFAPLLTLAALYLAPRPSRATPCIAMDAGFNLFAVAFVYCFYPETACRTLEEIDLLFASKNPFVWETEKRFQELKLEHADLGLAREGGIREKSVGAAGVEEGGEKA